MPGSPTLCSMDLSGRLLGAPRSANTPQKWRLGALVLLQILCFQTARSQAPPNIFLEPIPYSGVVDISPKILARCIVTSTPMAEVTWDSGSFEHDAANSFHKFENLTGTVSSTLLMKPQREIFDLKVTCVATIEKKSSYNTSIVLKSIQFAPYNVFIAKFPRSDGALEIYCDVKANPNPDKYKWTWVKGQEVVQIPSTNKYLVVEKTTTGGYYMCEVENSFGRASGRYYIEPETVHHPYWYIALIFLIPSLILNAGLLIHCLKSRQRSPENPAKDVL